MDLQDRAMTYGEKWLTMLTRRMEENRRKSEDRVRVIVTMVNEPGDDPAEFFYLQVRATDRLRRAMAEFRSRYPRERSAFHDAPANVLPHLGPQLRIEEDALLAVTGYWGSDDWRDGVRLDHVHWALEDFVHGLTGYHAQVQWAIS